MNARAFHNAIRILLNLGEDNLRLAGVIDENWGTPRGKSDRDQLDAAFSSRTRSSKPLRMPDANFERLCDLIEQKQPADMKDGNWRSAEAPPEDGSYVDVRVVWTYRYKLYKPDGRRQMRTREAAGSAPAASTAAGRTATRRSGLEWRPNEPVKPKRTRGRKLTA
jgi:hypothetical protein